MDGGLKGTRTGEERIAMPRGRLGAFWEGEKAVCHTVNNLMTTMQTPSSEATSSHLPHVRKSCLHPALPCYAHYHQLPAPAQSSEVRSSDDNTMPHGVSLHHAAPEHLNSRPQGPQKGHFCHAANQSCYGLESSPPRPPPCPRNPRPAAERFSLPHSPPSLPRSDASVLPQRHLRPPVANESPLGLPPPLCPHQ